jgi:3-O-methylgallate 3,4-dioxygenase
MAQIVLGVGTSHTPLLILPPEMWSDYAARDRGNPELVFPPSGLAMSFDDAVGGYVPAEIQQRSRGLDLFRRQSAASQAALDQLAGSLRAARPDVIVIVSDDQDEWFYDSNMPAFSVYWGESVPIIPRPEPAGSPLEIEMALLVNAGYAARRVDVPVDARLGRHLVEYLIEHDFDVSQMSCIEPSYGGRVARRYPAAAGGELAWARQLQPRPVGLPHGYSFVVQRLLDGMGTPIVPVIQNTCYPPNAVTPRRCYALGEALAAALAEWDDGVRVAVVASGGLSHFVVDEVIDRALLDAVKSGDKEALTSLPRERLRSATSECLNWVTVAATMAGTGLHPEVLSYEAVYRTEAGTGAGLGFARWV